MRQVLRLFAISISRYHKHETIVVTIVVNVMPLLKRMARPSAPDLSTLYLLTFPVAVDALGFGGRTLFCGLFVLLLTKLLCAI